MVTGQCSTLIILLDIAIRLIENLFILDFVLDPNDVAQSLFYLVLYPLWRATPSKRTIFTILNQ